MKKSFVVLTLSLLLFTSCKGNSTNSSSSSSSSSSSINNSADTILFLNQFKEELLAFDGNVSKRTYQTVQTNDYSGLDMEIKETGDYTLYQDNFLINQFSQTINDSTNVSGRRERGIADSSRLYQITYYGNQDGDNSVTYYVNNEANLTAMFNLGFVSEYISQILDTTIYYYEMQEQENLRLSLTTNYSQVSFPTNGTITLQYRFIYYANTSMTKLEEVQRDDILTIENGMIVSSSTTMLYALQDAINYQYMTSEATYIYDTIQAFDGTKLNPTDFPVRE